MKTVGIFLYNNIEVLDFAGPFEVFSTAQRIWTLAGRDPSQALFKVVTIAEQHKLITARGGLQVVPNHLIEYHPHIDILIVPGGIIDHQLTRAPVINWLRTTSERADLTASVCTGAFLLAEAGLLDGCEVITHWEDSAALQQSYPKLIVRDHARWLDQGHIVTSAGISAGIDMSLHLVSRFASMEHAERTAHQMDYHWQQQD
ncbi:MAG: DJ-1/PfpI family protein [Desulfobulbaceae bacterium]|nr:MAG: DJ-1/PfpI family protein [Desulfobulbaceae bacterium]